MATSGVQKICVSCGENVANKPRTKDQRGRYYCNQCWAERRHGNPCTVCGADFAKQRLIKDEQGLCFCQVCWDGRNTEQVDLSALDAHESEHLVCPACAGTFAIPDMDASGVCRTCAATSSTASKLPLGKQTYKSQNISFWKTQLGLITAIVTPILFIGLSVVIWMNASSKPKQSTAEPVALPPSGLQPVVTSTEPVLPNSGMTERPLPQSPSAYARLLDVLAAPGPLQESVTPILSELSTGSPTPSNLTLARRISSRLIAEENLEKVAELPLPPGDSDTLLVSPNGHTILYSTANGLKMLNVDSMKTKDVDANDRVLAFVGNDKVVDPSGNGIAITSLEDGQRSAFPIPVDSNISAFGGALIAASTSSGLIAYGGTMDYGGQKQSMIYTFDARTGNLAAILKDDSPVDFDHGSFASIGRPTLVTSQSNQLLVWDLGVSGGRLTRSIQPLHPISNPYQSGKTWLKVSSDRKLYYFPPLSTALDVYDLTSGQLQTSFATAPYNQAYGMTPLGEEVLFSRPQPEPEIPKDQPVHRISILLSGKSLQEESYYGHCETPILAMLNSLAPDGTFNLHVLSDSPQTFQPDYVSSKPDEFRKLTSFLSQERDYHEYGPAWGSEIAKEVKQQTKPDRIIFMLEAGTPDVSIEMLNEIKAAGIEPRVYVRQPGGRSAATFAESRASLLMREGRSFNSDNEQTFELWNTEKRQVGKIIDGTYSKAAMSEDGSTIALRSNNRIVIFNLRADATWKTEALASINNFFHRSSDESNVAQALVAEAASGRGQQQAEQQKRNISDEMTKRAAAERVALASTKAKAAEAKAKAEVAPGTPRAIAGELFDKLINQKDGFLRKADFVDYFEPAGFNHWATLPDPDHHQLRQLGLHYTFEFVTDSGVVRVHQGFVSFVLNNNQWEATAVDFDGQGEISVNVLRDGGFVIRN